jgi:hypothetical protein
MISKESIDVLIGMLEAQRKGNRSGMSMVSGCDSLALSELIALRDSPTCNYTVHKETSWFNSSCGAQGMLMQIWVDKKRSRHHYCGYCGKRVEVVK